MSYGTALSVTEVFGPTFHGEGPFLGRRCGFVRFRGCNLKCAGCDTTYSWGSSTRPNTVVEDVLAGLDTMGFLGLVVLTGGEPLLQQYDPGFKALVDSIADRGTRMQVETNATLIPSDFILTRAAFVASPKVAGLPLNGGQNAPRQSSLAIEALSANGAHFKFVVRGEKDLDVVATFVDNFGLDTRRIWVMPFGKSDQEATETARDLAPHVLAAGYNLTPRFHLTLWPGEERGH